MDQNCGNCIYLDLYDKSERSEWGMGKYTGYWCKEERKYMHPEKDGKYCRYHQEKPNTYNSNSCFITTVVVNILGQDDNCQVLKTLRSFRKNVLIKTNDGIELLKMYDVIGPSIAKNISLDDNKRLLCFDLYANYIAPAAELVIKEKYDDAKSLYKAMVNYLQIKYNISFNSKNYVFDSSVKIDQIGHGTAMVHKVNVKA